MTTEIRMHHFTVRSEGVLELVRQAYWMENRKDWALDTLRCYKGINESQIEHLLNGTATLKSSKDGMSGIYKETPDTEWQETLAKHLEWVESRTYLFAGRRVPKDLVDNYTDNIVRRIRDSLSSGAVVYLDPLYTVRLEEQRQEQHDAIFLAAGFTKEDLAKRKNREYDGLSDDFKAFENELSAHTDKKAAWLTGGRKNE
jgi:hypothetical protein